MTRPGGSGTWGLVIALVVGVASLLFLWRVGAFADPYGRAMRQIMSVRARPPRPRYTARLGHATSSSSATTRLVGWIEERTSLSLLLAKAGRRQNAPRYLATLALAFFGVAAVSFAVDAVALATGTATTPPVSPGVALGFGILVAAAGVLDLPLAVQRRRRALNDALTECIVPLTIVLATGAVSNRLEALGLFAQSLDDPTLTRFLLRPEAFGRTRDEHSCDYRVLIPDADSMSDVDLFRAIGEVYELEVKTALSHALHQIREQGRPIVEAMASVAKTFLTQKVDAADDRVESGDRHSRLPMLGFVLLVFAGILAPAVNSIWQALR